MRLLALATFAALLTAGCASTTDDHHEMAMGPDTYHMLLSGVPAMPMAPNATFNVTVQAEMGMGMAMAHHASDHIGAHFWNRTVSDPTANVTNGTACAHRVGDLPGTFEATCKAPLMPGVYHIRAHSRISDNGTMHHWWSDEQTFTVA